MVNAANAAEFVHETAIIDHGAHIGTGTRVWHWVHVCGGAVIGENCSLGQNVFVGNKVRIGNRVKIQNNVSVYDNVTLEDGVFCGPSMVFTNVFNPRAEIERKSEYRDTIVCRGATLGANCTIICGVTIGEYAFIGAGAVVNCNVPSFALMVGVPARRLGWMSHAGERLGDDLVSRGKVVATAWLDPSALKRLAADRSARRYRYCSGVGILVIASALRYPMCSCATTSEISRTRDGPFSAERNFIRTARLVAVLSSTVRLNMLAAIQYPDGSMFGKLALISRFPFIESICGNGGYQGPIVQNASPRPIEIVKRNQSGVEALAKRWIVERTFAWLGINRRLAKDCERFAQTSRAFIQTTMIKLMTRQLARFGYS